MSKSIRLAFLGSLMIASAVAGAGCGDSVIPAAPNPVLGTYKVMIAANGKTDSDEMTVVLGSNNNVLLSFVYGISEVRCSLMGSTALTVPNQNLTVNHSIGPAQGIARGEGTFTLDTTTMLGKSLDLTIHLSTTNFGTSDGGSGLGSAGVVDYHITGTK